MKAPLSRTARTWALMLLLGGISLLAAITWIGFGRDHTKSEPKADNDQPPVIPEGLEANTPPVVPTAQLPLPKIAKPDLQEGRKPDLQVQAPPAQAESPAAAPPKIELAPSTTVPFKTGIFGGLNRIVGLVASMRDAGTAGAK